MIKFIDLTTRPSERKFGFYDDVDEELIRLNHQRHWGTVKAFQKDYTYDRGGEASIEEFVKLVPKDFFTEPESPFETVKVTTENRPKFGESNLLCGMEKEVVAIPQMRSAILTMHELMKEQTKLNKKVEVQQRLVHELALNYVEFFQTDEATGISVYDDGTVRLVLTPQPEIKTYLR